MRVPGTDPARVVPAIAPLGILLLILAAGLVSGTFGPAGAARLLTITLVVAVAVTAVSRVTSSE